MQFWFTQNLPWKMWPLLMGWDISISLTDDQIAMLCCLTCLRHRTRNIGKSKDSNLVCIHGYLSFIINSARFSWKWKNWWNTLFVLVEWMLVSLQIHKCHIQKIYKKMCLVENANFLLMYWQYYYLYKSNPVALLIMSI